MAGPTPKRKMRPVLDGDWWLIGPSPDLIGQLPGAEEYRDGWEAKKGEGEHNACVDHHIFLDTGGTWHLWGCVRSTAVGRIFYHWTADDFTASPWKSTGEILRIDRDYGESYGSSPGEGSDESTEECIQSPFFLWHGGLLHMFYGGGGAREPHQDDDGTGTWSDWHQRGAQMCLMTSKDGHLWHRYRNSQGQSRLFVGPGPTRDPCVIRVGDLWHIYYAGCRDGDPELPVFWCRTSRDLIEWSAPINVHEDPSYGPGRWDTECPHVVFRDGYYYLFRTEDYYTARTHVFRSEDPLDFGVGDASDFYVGPFPAAAPELYTMPDGREYVSSNHNPPLGTEMCRMRWVPVLEPTEEESV